MPLTSLVPIRLALAWFHLLALGVGPGAADALARCTMPCAKPARTTIKRALMTHGGNRGRRVVGDRRLVIYRRHREEHRVSKCGKMGRFIAILALEAWPMMTLIRWRMGKREPNTRDAGRIEAINYVECALVVGMVFAAWSMARGFGVPRPTSAATLTIHSPPSAESPRAVSESVSVAADVGRGTPKPRAMETAANTIPTTSAHST